MQPAGKNWSLPASFQQVAKGAPEDLPAHLERESGLVFRGPGPRAQDAETALDMLSRPLLPRSLGAEIWAVAGGVKPAGRAILFHEEDLKRMRDFCTEQQLVCLESEIPVRVSHLVVGEQQDHRGGSLFFYGREAETLRRLLVLDQEILNAVTKEETFGPSAEHGGLLGYPPCCIKTFVQEIGAGENRAIKERWHQLHGGGGWWPLNVLNQIGPVLLGYYPCSLKCEASLDYARKVMALEAVKKVLVDARFGRALSGVFFYWLDRLQVWHPAGRPDLAVHCQMLADGFSELPFAEEVDFLFSVCVVARMKRAATVRVESGCLVLELEEGEVRVFHPQMPVLRFEMEEPPGGL